MKQALTILFWSSFASGMTVSSPSGCGGDSELSATNDAQYIETPNYGLSEYPGDLDCKWVITNGGSGPLELTFSDPFWLETGYTHCYDTLTIVDDSTGQSWSLCGEDVPDDIVLETDRVTVTLVTDSYNNYDGFRMFFKTSGDVATTTTEEPASTVSTDSPPVTQCPPSQWECASGQCIYSSDRCDGKSDCEDGSDEADCPPPKSCGHPAINPDVPDLVTRVINGEEAVAHSWPWQISIQSQDGGHYCGGSLLSSNWVITAAHCAKIVFIGEYSGDQVVVGMHDRQTTEQGKEVIKIGAKFTHPSYDSPDRANDIALLKLDTPATLGDTVSPPCLPHQGDYGDTSSYPPGMKCVLTGWGKIGDSESVSGDVFGQPWRLRQTALPLLTDADCETIYLEGAGFTIQETMQCAGGDGHTACNGDSGGPMVCQGEDGYWYQVGIVSFGPAPCDATIPGVYTRVAGYVKWIDDTVNANGGY